MQRRDLFRGLDAVLFGDRGPMPTWVEEAAACGAIPIALGADPSPDSAAPPPIADFETRLRGMWVTPTSARAALEDLAAAPDTRTRLATALRAWMTTHGSWDVRATAWGRLFRRMLTPESPHVVENRRTLAIAAETAGELRGALRHWHRVLTAQPLSPSAHAGLGRVYRRMGQAETAYAFAQRAQALAGTGTPSRRATSRRQPT